MPAARQPDSFTSLVLEQLDALDGLRCRRMFGGYGLYAGSAFFGIIHDGRLFFKVDQRSQPDYAARGMQPFRPSERQVLKRYYEVPPEVVEERDQLLEWARRAAAADDGRSPDRPRR